MSLEEMLDRVAQVPLVPIVLFASLPVLVVLLRLLHGGFRAGSRHSGGRAPWRYFYSVIIYLACIPGMLLAVLVAYLIFFRRADLLKVNIYVYFLPILSMIITLVLIKGAANYKDIPGFDRLSGFMLLLGVSFGIALLIDKTRVWLFFGGSFLYLLLLAAILFGLMKWANHLIFKKSRQRRGLS
jgi:hypothetical protein